MATATAQQQKQSAPRQVSDQQAAAAITRLVAAGVGTTALAAALATAAGVSLLVASRVVTLTGGVVEPIRFGPALAQTIATERAYRAAFLVAAARRVQARVDDGMSLADAIGAERGNMAAHLAAQANRRQAALAVDKAAARHGGLLGWHAVMDSRTSAECAAANGRNFEVGRRPLIGWPGSVHPHCRCRPVAPFAGAGLVDQVVTAAERKAAVA